VILVRPVAARELADDIAYYDRQYPGRGQRFAIEVDRVLGLIDELAFAHTKRSPAYWRGRLK
jgi:hypothetical protein